MFRDWELSLRDFEKRKHVFTGGHETVKNCKVLIIKRSGEIMTILLLDEILCYTERIEK